jgi:hypothetical protein
MRLKYYDCPDELQAAHKLLKIIFWACPRLNFLVFGAQSDETSAQKNQSSKFHG